MKKILIPVLVLALLTALAGCKKGEEPLPPSVIVSRAPVHTVNPEQPADTQAEDTWSGDWYGWWSISNAGGIYADSNDGACWWDACARISLTNGKGTLLLWDEETSAANPLAGMEARLSTREKGCLEAGNGTFNGMETNALYWLVGPNSSLYPDTVSFNGRYDDPEHIGSYFTYTVTLRPWGASWEDLPENARPYHYAWYNEQVSAGQTMPDTIG